MANFNLTPEQLEAAKKAKSPEELIEMAKAHGIEITAEQAKAFLAPPVGELSDEELENVAGGGGDSGENVNTWKEKANADGRLFKVYSCTTIGTSVYVTSDICPACDSRGSVYASWLKQIKYANGTPVTHFMNCKCYAKSCQKMFFEMAGYNYPL